METYELRYFLAVARCENVNKASRQVAVSAGSLSKAISRLEAELGVNLFNRVGRNIQLTDEGRILLIRAGEIIQLEELTRAELQGSSAGVQVRIVAPEILLSKIGLSIIEKIRKYLTNANFVLTAASEQETEKLIQINECHIGITTKNINSEFFFKNLFSTSFCTVVGKRHPLFHKAKANIPVLIEEVLQYEFVCPDKGFLGIIEKSSSLDGWRDDKFARKIGYVVNSIKMIEELLIGGYAIAYLPKYFCDTLPVAALNIVNCHYTCDQVIKIFCKDPNRAVWLQRIFDI